MNVFQKILKALSNIFNRQQRSTDDIVANYQRTITDLVTHADTKKTMADAAAEAAEGLLADKAAHNADAEKALVIANSLNQVFNGVALNQSAPAQNEAQQQ